MNDSDIFQKMTSKKQHAPSASPFGWIFINIPEPYHTQFLQFHASLPGAWKTTNKGKKDATVQPQLHSTFVSKLDSSKEAEIISTLKKLKMAPFSVQFKGDGLFCQSVSRLLPKKISCAGVALQSQELRSTRETVAKAVNGTVYYEGDGHVSLVYVEGQYEAELQALILQKQPQVQGKSFLVTELIVQFGANTYTIELK